MEDLETAVQNLSAGGLTNHRDACTKALDLFDPSSTNEKIMVMFTDGRTTTGGDAAPVAAAAKAQGVSIYVIGLSGNGGIDEDALKEWASDPDSAYVAITPSDEEHNVVHFPSPKIRIDCDMSICPEACQEPTDVTIDGCEDTVEYNVGELGLDSPGRILQLYVTLKNVCPHRRVALAAILNEADDKGIEHKRGLKTITVPAHDRPECRPERLRRAAGYIGKHRKSNRKILNKSVRV